eukprot:gnl/TRDRNA2_/TRDRNA2_172579_c6_seq4.p1 gnl/TRDRNA2_/TRDRNA2_172579_c6~~gnl/TRDRNA2_/TRDRNA2_172579_c6_seq4.p1  ORF type:complete len:207 (-),score=35.88 gnl/TRDRNA2_/TRDRNA2_172579_c6_seq4:482-1102(-)
MAQPSPQVVGGRQNDPVSDMQREMAAAAAREGARQAGDKARFAASELKAYIQENPASVKVMCFLVGLILIVFSIMGCFNLFGAAFKPKEYLGNVYNACFGLIICICDGKESWMVALCDVQAKLFKYAYFLATQTGRALFYFYVGSMTILVLPDSTFWQIFYIVIGSLLCLLALLMLFLQWCGPYCGCQASYGDLDNRSSEPAPTSL